MALILPNPSLVVLCGPAASGKSMFAARNFPPNTTVSADRCKAMVGESETDTMVTREAFEVFHLVIDRRLRLGRFTVADSTALRMGARQALLQIGRRYAVPVIAIVFDISFAHCCRNGLTREKVVGRPVIEHHFELFREALRSIPGEGFDEVYVLDGTTARAIEVRMVSRN